MGSLLTQLFLAVVRFAGRLRQMAFKYESRASKAKMRKCGRGVFFYGRHFLTGAENMEVGDNIHIGENAYIRAEGGLTIGDNVHISRNLSLYTINHRYEGRRLPFEQEMDPKPVVIGRNVWIGMNVCITPGTIIGDGAVIGMGTVVFGEVEPLAVVVPEKWRVLKYRNADHYRQLDEMGSYGGRSGTAWEPMED